MKKNNARLEWRGRKLMCNGIAILRILPPHHQWGMKWHPIWAESGNPFDWRSESHTEEGARNAVNRRFKIEVPK